MEVCCSASSSIGVSSSLEGFSFVDLLFHLYGWMKRYLGTSSVSRVHVCLRNLAAGGNSDLSIRQHWAGGKLRLVPVSSAKAASF